MKKNRKKRIALGIGIFLAVYALAGFLIIPLIAQSIVPDKLSAALERPVTIDKIALNPFALSLTVTGLAIAEPQESDVFVSFEELYVNLQLRSVVKLGPVIREVRLTRPYLRIVRQPDNTFNFSDLIAAGDAEESAPARSDREKKPLRFALQGVQVIEGEVVFDDKAVDTTHRFSPLNFELPRLSSFEGDMDVFSQPLLMGRVNDTDIAISAKTKLFADSLETIVDFDIKGLRLSNYFPYAPEDIGFEVTDGHLDIHSSLSVNRKENQELSLEVSGKAHLSNLALVDDNEDNFFSLAGLDLVLAPSAPLENSIHLSSLVLDRPHLTIVRGVDGVINLATLGPGAETDNAGNDGPAEKAVEVGSPENADIAIDNEAPSQPPFIVAVDEIRIHKGRTDYSDFAAPSATDPPMVMVMDDMELAVDGFSNKPDQSADVAFHGTVNQSARIDLTGTAGVAPLTADVRLQINGVESSWGQSYVPEKIRLAIAGGVLDLEADARVETTPEGEISARVAGNTSLKDFSLLDRDQGSDLLTIRLFSVEGIHVNHNPGNVQLDEILLDGLNHEIVRQEDGTFNLTRILGATAEKTAEKEESENEVEIDAKADISPADSSVVPIPVAIEEIRLQDISVNFTDRHIDPNFKTRLDLTHGSIKGLTSESFDGADLEVNATVDQQAPVDISGRINPLLSDPMIDVAFSLKNLELSPMSPYSGAYIGNAIEKGKLHLDLVYNIKEKHLSAQNRILMDQFTLGRRIDSPDALSLPVGLAVALLKDRRGEIHLDIPVSGRTDDPRFSVGGIIVQALTNIIARAATSPFALVGSLVGGGEELQYIEFEYGRPSVHEKSLGRMDAVEEILFQRPELSLEMTGYVDVEKDREILAILAFERELKTMKWADTGQKNGKDSITADEVTFSDEEYETYLKKLYEKKVLDDPEAGPEAKPVSDESLTRAEMTDAIMRQITVPDAALWLLARQRVQAVREYILAKERIDGQRLFILEAKALSPEQTQGDFSKARVSLGLK